MEETKGIAEWIDDGTSFIIYDVDKFSKLLPKYFKTDNFASFVRQLNMYKFQKMKNSKGYHQFIHYFFKKGCPQDLIQIRRKIPSGYKINKIISKKKNMSSDVDIKFNEKLNRLEKTLKLLTMQNGMLLNSNNKILKSLIENKASTDLKLRKLLIITHKATKHPALKNKDSNQVFSKIITQIMQMQRNIEKSHSDLLNDFSSSEGLKYSKNDELFNEALDLLYEESDKMQNPVPYRLVRAKEDAEEKLLNQITENDNPGRLFCIDEAICVSNNNFVTDRDTYSCGGFTPHNFGFSEIVKKEQGFTPLRSDIMYKFSPHLVKPYSIYDNSFSRN